MESGIKRTQRDYTLDFKLSVVDQIDKGELTYIEAQCRYGIIALNVSSIKPWCIHTTYTRAANQGAGRAQEGLRGACRKKAFGQVLAQRLVKGLSVCRACRHMGISRQAYYQRLRRQDEVRKCNERVIERVRSKRLRQSHMLVTPRRAYHKTTDTATIGFAAIPTCSRPGRP
jgi:transposase-like protein